MILVTGGTGLVGSHLLYELLKRYDRVRAIYRAESDVQQVRHIFTYYTSEADELYNRIEWKCANLLDIPKLSEAFEGVTHVYHAAAYISFDSKNYAELRKANVEGTANIVNLCISNAVAKLCYVSSVATLGTPLDQEPANEDTHWNPEAKNSVYAITKYGAEMEVWRGTQEGVSAVIVNPSVILGPGFWTSGSGAIISLAARGTRFYTPGGTGVVDVRDVARAMLCLMYSEISNERFVLNAHNISFKELISRFSSQLQAKAPSTQIPKWLCTLTSYLDGLSSTLLGTKRKLPLATVRSLYTVSRYDGSKIERQSPDFTYTPFEDSVRHISEKYLQEHRT
jgi:nucleoside-diphosphate-sugar epimerase